MGEPFFTPFQKGIAETVYEFVNASHAAEMNTTTESFLLHCDNHGYPSLPRPSSAFYAQFTRPYSTTRQNAIRTTCSSPLTRTDKHSSMSSAQPARQQCCKQNVLSLMNIDLVKAPCSLSPLRPRLLTCAMRSPFISELHPLQMRRSK